MAIEDILFGEAPEAVIESRDVTSQAQQDALTALLAELQGPAPSVAVPVTAGQQTLIDQSVGGQATAQGEISESGDILRGLLDPSGSFQQEVEDPLVHAFQTRIAPQISRGFGNEFFSSERQQQDRFAVEDLMRNMLSEKSRFLREDRGVQLGAASGFREGAGQRGDILKSFLESAGAGRDIEAQNLLNDEQVRQQLLQMLLGGGTAPTRETVGISQGGSEGLLASFLGGAGAGAGEAGVAALMSDKRLKKNIIRIGTYLCGAPKYLFQYLWGEWSIGVMAQEISDYVDDAVITTDSGYFAVNYSKFS